MTRDERTRRRAYKAERRAAGREAHEGGFDAFMEEFRALRPDCAEAETLDAERRAVRAIEREATQPAPPAERVFDRWGNDRTETLAGLARLGVTAEKWEIELTAEGAIIRTRSAPPHDTATLAKTSVAGHG
jgi:hypothetical protein